MKLKEAIVMDHKTQEQIAVQNNIIKDQYKQIFASKAKAALTVSEVESEMLKRPGDVRTMSQSREDVSPYQNLTHRRSVSPELRKFNEKRAVKNKNKVSKTD